LSILPPLEKKKSCNFTNVVSTCVNKASSHLELLQTLIEEWFASETASHPRVIGELMVSVEGMVFLCVFIQINDDL